MASARSTHTTLAFAAVTTLFFAWGFITSLIDPLVAAVKGIFTLTDVQAQLATSAFFIAYGVASFPAAALLARLKEIARAQPDTRELSCEPDCERIARFLQRTRMMRFPDTIDVEVFPAPGGSTLAIYSRSLIGRRDFGVNRARIARWLAALE